MRETSILARGRASVLGLLACAALCAGAAHGQGADRLPPTDFAAGADSLQPGQFIWTPSVAPTGPMSIYVDLSRQLAAVYRGGVRIGVTTISSGREGYETPTGVFRIMSKDAKHHSNRYDNAPMPFSQRLTDDGVALHAGRVPGYPESHGCVHLPYSFAKALFSETRVGVTVVVMDGDGSDTGVGAAPGQVSSTVSREAPEPSSESSVTLVSSKSN